MSTGNISYGFLRPSDERFSEVSLTVECGGEVISVSYDTEERNATELQSWGRGNDVQVKAEFNVDLPSVIEDCDLPIEGSRLGTLLRWNCPATSIRGFGTTFPLDNGVNQLTAHIPGGRVSGTVAVELDVVLIENPVEDPASVAPKRPGSVLWSRKMRLHLEGIGSSVPTTSHDFVEVHDPDPRAMWRIQLESDPELHVTRAVRVYLNTANKVTKTALDNINSGNNLTRVTQMWQRFLDIDLRTHLVWSALGIAQERGLTQFENDEESYGQMLHGILSAYFPGQDHKTLLQQATSDPGMVTARVQNNYGDER